MSFLVLIATARGLASPSTEPQQNYLTAEDIRGALDQYLGREVVISVGQITPSNLRRRGFWFYYADTVRDSEVDGTILIAIPKPFFAEAEDLIAFRSAVGRFLSKFNYQLKPLPWRQFPEGGQLLRGILVQNGSSIAIVVKIDAGTED
jgi:hypothetical protein